MTTIAFRIQIRVQYQKTPDKSGLASLLGLDDVLEGALRPRLALGLNGEPEGRVVHVLGGGGHLQLTTLLQVARGEAALARIVDERRVGNRAGPQEPVDVRGACRRLASANLASFRRLAAGIVLAAAQSGELATQFLGHKEITSWTTSWEFQF